MYMTKSSDKSGTQNRLVMLDLRKQGFPCIPLLGEYSFRKAQPVLAPHRHKGAMEICYLREGRQTYKVAGRDFVLGPGDVFISFPDELHGTGESPQEVGSLYWLQVFPADSKKSIAGLSQEYSAILTDALMKIPVRFFHGLPVIRDNFAQLFELVKKLDDKLARVRFGNLFVELLLNILRSSEIAGPQQRPGVIQSALDYINANLDKPLQVGEIAEHVGLSESWFKARFKKELGMPPAEYVIRKRMDAATEMLKSGKENVTQIAYKLCFSSSQHFSAAYKRFTGKSPREMKGLVWKKSCSLERPR